MYSTTLMINYADELLPAQQLQLPVYTATGSLTIVYITMRYIVAKGNRKKVIEEKAWLPGAFVSAMFN